MAGRYIKLFEQVTKWGWYQNGNTFRLFIHLLLKANFEDSIFEGIQIYRGQVVTSLDRLSKELNLSVREIRTALNHLISTSEVTTLSYAKFRVITISKYNEFQTATKLLTSERQATDKLPTSYRQHNKNTIEEIEEKEETESIVSEPTPKRFSPPSKEEVFDYCLNEGYGIDVDRFYDYYSSNGWKVGKNPMKDWKAAVRYWSREKHVDGGATGIDTRKPKTVAAQQYSQRDYTGEQQEALMRMIAGARRDGIT